MSRRPRTALKVLLNACLVNGGRERMSSASCQPLSSCIHEQGRSTPRCSSRHLRAWGSGRLISVREGALYLEERVDAL